MKMTKQQFDAASKPVQIAVRTYFTGKVTAHYLRMIASKKYAHTMIHGEDCTCGNL